MHLTQPMEMGMKLMITDSYIPAVIFQCLQLLHQGLTTAISPLLSSTNFPWQRGSVASLIPINSSKFFFPTNTGPPPPPPPPSLFVPARHNKSQNPTIFLTLPSVPNAFWKSFSNELIWLCIDLYPTSYALGLPDLAYVLLVLPCPSDFLTGLLYIRTVHTPISFLCSFCYVKSQLNFLYFFFVIFHQP